MLPPNTMSIQRMLSSMGQLGASDLHLKVGIAPTYRINGLLRSIQSAPFTPEEADRILDPIIPPAIKARFEAEGNVDFAIDLAGGDRFRVNIFRAGGHTHAAIRRVKSEIPSYENLHLPPIYSTLIERTTEGLILVVGVTGSGKSSTLAAMMEHINVTRCENMITVEDPVEYKFIPKKCIISQREIGIDVRDYAAALKYIVREDPDVVFIGEMRDHDTVLAAIQAAETGHLVFGSMHTADTMQAFNRILEFFPSDEHSFLRGALANSLKAICAQRLLPALPDTGWGVAPATEVLLSTPTVKEKIREGQEADLPAVIGGSADDGMHSFTNALADLAKREIVATSTAREFAPNRDALDSALKGVEVKAQTLVHRIRAGGKT